MQQSGRRESDPLAVRNRDNLAWHPAMRGSAAGLADELALSSATRLVARLEEETHTLTTQLAYLQSLLQQVKDTLTVIQQQAGPNAHRDPGGRLLSQRMASAQADGYQLPVTTRR
jgi:hypothetical protein